jgi:hypothetical protein
MDIFLCRYMATVLSLSRPISSSSEEQSSLSNPIEVPTCPLLPPLSHQLTPRSVGSQKLPKKKTRIDDMNQSLTSTTGGSVSASLHGPSANNTIAILNISTMTWTQPVVDLSATSSAGLNLIGHSIALSPVNPQEIFIFGGRKSDESPTPTTRSKQAAPPTATLWTLNLDTLALSEAALKCPADLTDLPEARLNQLFIRRQDEMVALKPPVPDDKSLGGGPGNGGTGRKGKSSRRAPTLPVKRPKLQPHAVLTLFGGSKLYSSGFCSGGLHEIFFIPIEKKESSWATAIAASDSLCGSDSLLGDGDGLSLQEMEPSTSGNARFSTMSIASVASRRMSAIQMVIENQTDTDEIFHMMNIKENSVTKLSSPKRGVGAHYFAMKTQLSRSRSTFSRPGSSQYAAVSSAGLPELRGTVSSPSRRPISAPSAISDRNDREGETLPASASSLAAGPSPESTSPLLRRHGSTERIKAFSSELSPLVKGLSVHDARQIFQRLHSPSPGLSCTLPLSSSSSAPTLHSSFHSTLPAPGRTSSHR